MTAPGRIGVTLIELLVALTLLGLMTAVVGVAIPRRDAPTAADEITRALSDARRAAIDSGHSVSITLLVGGTPRAATILPDGSVVADSGLAVDRLSGAGPAAHAPHRGNGEM